MVWPLCTLPAGMNLSLFPLLAYWVGKMGKMSPVVPVRDSLVSVGDQIPAVSNHPGQFPKVCFP